MAHFQSIRIAEGRVVMSARRAMIASRVISMMTLSGGMFEVYVGIKIK
jgi:hypothetical protein